MNKFFTLLSVAFLIISCQKDIKKNDIGTNSIIVKSDTCFAFLPNAFTPDGNGSNDVLRPVFKVSAGNTFTFTVRNRKQKVLFSTSIQGESWDGLNQAEGEYIVILAGTLACGMSYEQHTCVNLFRNCITGDLSKMQFEDMYDNTTGSVVFASQEKSCP